MLCALAMRRNANGLLVQLKKSWSTIKSFLEKEDAESCLIFQS